MNARDAHPVEGLTDEEVARQWDRIAAARHLQIAEGQDISYSMVVGPALLELAALHPQDRVLDVGCGTGHFSAALANRSESVVGIDISGASIAVARREFDSVKNLSFEAVGVEEFAAAFRGSPFDLATAHMSLMTVLKLNEVLEAISGVLTARSKLVASITHPWFWPMYWGYNQAEWFRYKDQIQIEANFGISAVPNIGVTTHVHRPLEAYVTALHSSGFRVCRVLEPVPDAATMAQYPDSWLYPRFLLFEAVRD